MISQIIKRAYRLLLAIVSVPIYSYFKYYDKNSKNVIWVMGLNFKYFFKTSILWDLATISAIIKSQKTYSICINNRISMVKNKNIFFTLHSLYNIFRFKNYVSILNYLLSEIQFSDNYLTPNLKQANYWENKAHMHRKFDELGIPTPKTLITNKKSLRVDNLNFKFPFIIKLIHSYESKGIFKINNKNELNQFLNDFDGGNEEFLIQEILNMRKDLRVIFVNNKIEHYYWRINNSSEWRPTATSKGNSVDFQFFPENHKKTIEKYSLDLGLTIGAFDIAWQNDDLSTIPMVLEVSPVFSPNPKTDNPNHLENYGEFKKALSFNGYDYLYVKEIFRLKGLHVSQVLNEIQ